MVQYQKDKREGYNNQSILDLIESEPDSILVAFQPIESNGMEKVELKKHLKEREAMVIQDLVPLFNIEENPRYLIHPIPKSKSNWTSCVQS
ncbi:hypothetical protein [Cytobacillus pseudoceanisediminis]|uniref:hypothetical protein n=1 Tax=Cytobacillus pseudoceanisediminis TaxID=3051614 RepID=UPI003CE8177E